MTKHLLFSGIFALALLALTSCGDSAPDGTDTSSDGDSSIVDLGSFDYDTLEGIYTGDFGKTNLKLVISYAGEVHATGYNIVKGVQRNISGKMTLKPETVEMELAEPGDNKNDGVFHISVDRKTLLMTGTWKPNDPKGKAKNFVLDRVVMPKDGDELTAGNFTMVFYHVGDSLGDLFFESNGACRYEYYVKGGVITGSSLYEINKGDETPTDMGQLQEIAGSWTLRKNKVIVEWEKNSVFSSQKSTFDVSLEKSEEGYIMSGNLLGEGRELGMYQY